MPEKIEPPPTRTARDRVVEIARSAAGELPLAGAVVEVPRQIFGTASNTAVRLGSGACTNAWSNSTSAASTSTLLRAAGVRDGRR